MGSTKRKFRSWVFGALANLGFGFRVIFGRLRGKPLGLPDCTLLEPGLFIGGRCDQPPPGTQAVLNVSAHPDEYTVEEYRWRPVQAGAAPTVGWLGEQVEFVHSCRCAGKTVFVHCDAGVDRSATVVIAYLMRQRRCTRDQALESVQRKRSVVRPSPVFMKLLEEWGLAIASVPGKGS